MCTLVILRRPGHDWPVLIAANRDENAERPWRPPARHWPDRPEVVAGMDELAGGTWLGLNDHGVVAGILNRPDSLGPDPKAALARRAGAGSPRPRGRGRRGGRALPSRRAQLPELQPRRRRQPGRLVGARLRRGRRRQARAARDRRRPLDDHRPRPERRGRFRPHPALPAAFPRRRPARSRHRRLGSPGPGYSPRATACPEPARGRP